MASWIRSKPLSGAGRPLELLALRSVQSASIGALVDTLNLLGGIDDVGIGRGHGHIAGAQLKGEIGKRAGVQRLGEGLAAIVRNVDTVGRNLSRRSRGVARLGGAVRAPGIAGANDEMFGGGVAFIARVEQNVADASASEETLPQHCPSLPPVGRAQNTQPLIPVTGEVIFAGSSKDDVRVLSVDGNAVDRQ